MRAKRLQLPVEYTAGDASKVDFSGDVDLVVALHACGALTDVALGHAISNAACFVICPCCFRSNPTLQVTLPSAGPSGIDRIRVEEWLGVDPIDYDVLKLLAEVQGDIALANQAIHTICALRASALAIRSERQVNVAIRTFPMAFSSRNFCLVGSYSS
jgi:Methyltransferase domain